MATSPAHKALINSSPTSPAEEVAKRQRHEAGLKLKVAEILQMCFYSPKSLSHQEYPVWFTHQIFDQEEFEILQYPDLRIRIYVNTITLYCFVVVINAPSSSIDYQRIQQILFPHLIENKFQFGSFDDFLQYYATENCETASPLGTVLSSWSFNDSRFQIRLSSHQTPGANDLLKSLEKLAIWYIETADSIDFSDSRFELAIVYEYSTDDDSLPSICGYMTLYTFFNPFLGNKLRICQALVLPHMQGQGIGRELILAAYQLASQRDDVVEVTVEDPADGFSKLRDAVDCEIVFTKTDWRSMLETSDHQKVESAKSLKMKYSQYVFALEALEYFHLTKDFDRDPVKNEVVDILRPFRLKVKKQLMKDHTEVKSAPKDRMRVYLDELFDERRERYTQVLKNRRIRSLVNA